MNAFITDSIREAITLIPIQEWKNFFSLARNAEYGTLTSTSDSELTTVKYRVMMINELEHLFTTARQQPRTNDTDES